MIWGQMDYMTDQQLILLHDLLCKLSIPLLLMKE